VAVGVAEDEATTRAVEVAPVGGEEAARWAVLVAPRRYVGVEVRSSPKVEEVYQSAKVQLAEEHRVGLLTEVVGEEQAKAVVAKVDKADKVDAALNPEEAVSGAAGVVALEEVSVDEEVQLGL
jgi:hypothetical protein